MSDFTASVDVRTYERKDKRTAILRTFESLAYDEKMELINDHDPKHLYDYFTAEFPEKFEWKYIEQGPVEWRIQIKKK